MSCESYNLIGRMKLQRERRFSDLFIFLFQCNAHRLAVRSNVKKEVTDMIQIFTNLDTLVELTKDIPLNIEIK